MRDGGFGAADLKDAGYTLSEAQTAGYSNAELVAAGYLSSLSFGDVDISMFAQDTGAVGGFFGLRAPAGTVVSYSVALARRACRRPSGCAMPGSSSPDRV